MSGMNISRCPCDGCMPPKRHQYCHANCPDYPEWVAEQKRKKQAKEMDTQVERYWGSKSKYIRKWRD